MGEVDPKITELQTFVKKSGTTITKREAQDFLKAKAAGKTLQDTFDSFDSIKNQLAASGINAEEQNKIKQALKALREAATEPQGPPDPLKIKKDDGTTVDFSNDPLITDPPQPPILFKDYAGKTFTLKD